MLIMLSFGWNHDDDDDIIIFKRQSAAGQESWHIFTNMVPDRTAPIIATCTLSSCFTWMCLTNSIRSFRYVWTPTICLTTLWLSRSPASSDVTEAMTSHYDVVNVGWLVYNMALTVSALNTMERKSCSKVSVITIINFYTPSDLFKKVIYVKDSKFRV